MSDYRERDPLYRNDPLGQPTGYEPAGRRSGLGWIAGAVVVVIVIGVAVGFGHTPRNGANPAPVASHTAVPPTAPGTPAHPMSMGLTPPPATAPAH
jgi:hypothetical protein